jgi:acyl-coenzyme A synthetase/AMP-(fatty) acid ligase
MQEDGNWLFFGRQDGMVKIWGYRVELGEVESCLLSHDDIEQAAVVKVSNEGELGDSLLAFVVLKTGQGVDPGAAEVVNFCRQNLPPYMCPKSVRFIDDIPLSHNGKIERLELVARASQVRAKQS